MERYITRKGRTLTEPVTCTGTRIGQLFKTITLDEFLELEEKIAEYKAKYPTVFNTKPL